MILKIKSSDYFGGLKAPGSLMEKIIVYCESRESV